MTKEEKRTVRAILAEVLYMGNKANTIWGSETLKEARKLWYKLECEPYCERHGIKFEDMTDEDFAQMYYEEYGA